MPSSTYASSASATCSGVPTSAVEFPAAPVIAAVRWRGRELSCSNELVVECEMRPTLPAPLAAGDVFPTAVAQKTVVAARHEFGAVLEAQPNWRRARKLLSKLRWFNSFDDIHSGNLAQWEDHGG